MNLLITSSAHGQDCATALLAATKIKTAVVPDVRTALARLREEEFSAVVVDESLFDASAKQMDVLLKHLGTAVPVFVNLATSRADRVVRDAQAALQRLECERAQARKAAAQELRGRFKDELTGILLWSEESLSMPAMPAPAQARIKLLRELAERMRAGLGAGE
jgi:hypothetical protein